MKKPIYYFLIFYLNCFAVLAQITQKNTTKDSLQIQKQLSKLNLALDKLKQDQATKEKLAQETAKQDSIRVQKDSVLYTNIQKKLSKSSLGRSIYNFMFHDLYRDDSTKQVVEQVVINPFLEHEGKVIRTIIIRQLPVFGSNVLDTLQKSPHWFEHWANKLHKNTREPLIRRSLLFDENQVLDADILWQNERLLRTNRIFIDARIIPVPDTKFPNIVDIYIITQDVWSLEPVIDIGSLDKYGIGLDQRNFRGLGHQFYNIIYYDKNTRYQPTEYIGRYRVPFIGKSLASAEANVNYQRDFKQWGVRGGRLFLTPQMRWAGAFEVSYNIINQHTYDLLAQRDTVLKLNFLYNDLWIGHAFPIHFGNHQLQERSKIVLAIRSTDYWYTRRPQLSDTVQYTFESGRTNLVSLGFSNRHYKKSTLIYGYGRTEDVPLGYRFSAIMGWANGEWGQRIYTGANIANGFYTVNGYFYGQLNVGHFIRNGKTEQGVLGIETQFFSPLQKYDRYQVRYFAKTRFTKGINRFAYEYISAGGDGGLAGINTSALYGTERFSASGEAVMFAPFSLAGFRMAFFGFANIAWVGTPQHSLWKSTMFQGFGLGVRLKNENLTFDTFQIRFTYYPNITSLSSPLINEFGSVSTLRYRDFDISAPEIVPFK